MHRLVAMHFIKRVNNKKEVNHKNGIKSDNRANNLEWTNRSENNKHSYRQLGRVSALIGKVGKLNVRSKAVIAINLSTNKKSTYESTSLASKYLSISQSNISLVCNGKRASIKGYSFKFQSSRRII